ncbi:replicase polyprotein, partial [Helleborus mosaic virus]
AGDDMCASRKLRTTTEHEGFLSKLKLKAKVAFTKTPTFCGWNLTHVGIFKKPQLVLERICIAKELNNLGNCIDNYALEVAFAYKLGESATCLMNEEELENHYQCVRTIVQNKHLIKSEVIKVYEKSQC